MVNMPALRYDSPCVPLGMKQKRPPMPGRPFLKPLYDHTTLIPSLPSANSSSGGGARQAVKRKTGVCAYAFDPCSAYGPYCTILWRVVKCQFDKQSEILALR